MRFCIINANRRFLLQGRTRGPSFRAGDNCDAAAILFCAGAADPFLLLLHGLTLLGRTSAESPAKLL